MGAGFKTSADITGRLLFPASGQGHITPTYVIGFLGSPTGGSFTATITTPSGSTTTSAITYSSGLTAVTVQAAVQGLSNVGAGNATVTGSNGGPFTVAFAASLGPVSLSVTPSLTGGSNPSATVTGVGVKTTVYTVPTATATRIAKAVIYNAGISTGTVLVSVIPAGATDDGSHVVVGLGTGVVPGLVAGDTTVISELDTVPLDAGVSLSISSTQPVCVTVTGMESA